MSFRKRGEVVNRRPLGGMRPEIRSAVPGRMGGVPSVVSGRMVAGRGVPSTKLADRGPLAGHPGVKPSILTSIPCTSTGSADLDKVLQHGGLPLGSLLLIEEDGTTDFATTLLKVYLSQGLVYNRLGKPNTHEIVIGPPEQWVKSLPGVYKGSSKDRKRKELEETQKRMTVTNVTEQQQQMKIAWRYGLQKQPSTGFVEPDTDYNAQFDIVSTMVPAANSTEITTIPIGHSYEPVLKQVEAVVRRYSDRLVRIALPLFLNPMLYSEESVLGPKVVLRFLHGLKSILKEHTNVVLLASINLDVHPRTDPMVNIIESMLMDGVLELRPFDPELYSYLERVYRKEPAKLKHGHLNVYKLPQLSDTGMMCVKEMELSFKNGKKRFEVDQWSIPVEGEDEDKSSSVEY